MSKKIPLINRELSWLEFNRRVLEEAQDPSLPLLERLKFLAITGSNLDEFFMVRVGGLQQLHAQGVRLADASGRTPARQLIEISERVHQIVTDQYRCLSESIEPGLRDAGICRRRPDELTLAQQRHLREVFQNQIFPVLTPIAVPSLRDFPLLRGLTLHLAVRLAPESPHTRRHRYAIVPVPRNLPRFIPVPAEGRYEYVLLEDVIGRELDSLFTGESILECVPFRITRNADMAVREDLAGDLLQQMKEVLTARQLSDCVRLEIGRPMSPQLLRFLRRALRVATRDVYETLGPLDLAAYHSLATLSGFDHLRFTPWPPQPTPDWDGQASLFEVLARKDLLLHHPYESFDPVVRLVQEAADDPDVLAIKQILYRTSRNSPIVAALMRAAQRGKQVTAVVELKARFDEARNIEWAQALEHAGVQVIYGLRRLKVHAKLCLIVRREPTGLRRYCHFGTGNYNELTAQLYSDISFLTSDPTYGADAAAFFNTITGYSQPTQYRKLDAAPLTLRARLLDLIDGERRRREQNQPARIRAKINSLVDPEIIHALYRASQAGVDIQLCVRGVCCLQPGVRGLSENIRVISIIDRFLEHSRILEFHHGGDDLLFISSADWMPRNLDRRVELLVPIESPALRARLRQILDITFEDNAKARLMLPEGRYQRPTPPGPLRSQERFYQLATEAARQARRNLYRVFEPQRPRTQTNP